jgi:hypothetical protein
MNHSGDAAEQVVRFAFEGMEFALRITGSAAKNVAALLLAALKSDGTDGKMKLRGRERLVNMLKSGKETKIFAVKNSDLKQFALEAKRYGVTYCVLKDKKGAPNELCEVMAKAEDASKIARIMDKLEFAAIPIASVESAPNEREAPDRDDTDKMLDELLGGEDGKAKPDQPEAEKAKEARETPENPTRARNGREPPSEPRSGTPSPSAEDTRATKKPASVKEFLRERTAAAKKREDKQPDRKEPDKAKSQQKSNQHQQPQKRGKKRSKSKER